MKLKEIPRTAIFSWSPDPKNPTVVTGTAAGTIDANFSAASELELWRFDLLDHSVASFTASPTASVETEARFHDVSFSKDGKFIVGAFENGCVEAWQSPTLKSVGKNDSTHSGAVKCVSFNNKEIQKFATGGSQGELFVWDINNMSQPFAPGTASAHRHADVESVSWNNVTAHILASGGNKGFASIWDTRRKREVLHLHYTSATGSRVPISSLQWHPTNSTRLATASMDDNEPVICIWDLKNVNSPEKVLRGHTKGVLSLDWCRQDENLLLSGGRDNATILWNPVSGEQLGSYPISVEWAFKTQFHPKLPDIFGSASFDGKISIQTLQDTNGGESSHTSSSTTQASGEDSDFWESENVMDTAHPNFKLQQPPKWLISPTSIKFGFGGKLVVASKSKVIIKSVKDSALDDDVIKGFSAAIKSKDFNDLITHNTDGSLGWTLLSDLISDKTIEIPEGPLSSDDKKSSDDEDDLFNFVPQYTPNSSLKLLNSKHPEVITAILANDFDTAVSKLIAAGQNSDALLVATYGEPGLVARAQNAYMLANADKQSYLRAAWAISQKHYEDLVDNSELEVWPSLLKALLDTPDCKVSTYKLGKRLLEAGLREDALRVYFAGKNVGAIAAMWLDELPQIEKKIATENKETPYIAHVKALQKVVEKITIITSKLGVPPLSDPGSDRLYSALRDYADIASQQGDLELAKLFLDMLPDEFAADKQRVDVATEKPIPSQRSIASRPAANKAVYASTPQPQIATGAPPVQVSTGFGSLPVSTSAPQATIPSSTMPSSRSGTTRASSYSTAGASKSRYPTNPYGNTGVSIAAASISGSNFAETPSPSPSIPPPPPAVGTSSAKPIGNGSFKGWNDVPELSTASRRTPAAPTRVAPAKPINVQAPPASNSASPHGSISAPPPGPARVAPPPGPARTGPPSGHSRAAPPSGPSRVAPSVGSANFPVAPSPAPRPPNPYATRNPARRSSPIPAKPNPYAPTPGTTPSPVNGAFMPPPDSIIAHRSATASPIAPPPLGTSKSKAPPPPPPVGSNSRSPSTAGYNSSVIPPKSSANVSPTSTQLSQITRPIQTSFQAELERVRPIVEVQHAKMYKDTVKRFGKLYECLPNLSDPVITSLSEISGAITLKDYTTANTSLENIMANHSNEAGDWLVAVKRLVKISEGIPV